MEWVVKTGPLYWNAMMPCLRTLSSLSLKRHAITLPTLQQRAHFTSTDAPMQQTVQKMDHDKACVTYSSVCLLGSSGQ